MSNTGIEVLEQERFKQPVGWQWDYFINCNRARIRYGSISNTYPKANIVILPGIIESGENYFETIRDFIAKDYSVWQMDWRGQGGSERYLEDRERAHSNGVGEHVSDVCQLIEIVVKRVDGPIIIIGHSWAGAATLLYLSSYPKVVSAAVLVAPAYSIDSKLPAWLVTTVSSLFCKIGKESSYAPDQGDWQTTRQQSLNWEMFTHDAARLQVGTAWLDCVPELRVGGATWRFVREFQHACNLVNKAELLNNISVPTLTISASNDLVADPKLQKKIAGQLPNGEYFSIEGARHALFLESDVYRNQLLHRIDQFIEEKVRAIAEKTVA